MPTDFNTSNLNAISTKFSQLRIDRYGADTTLTTDQINELKSDAVKALNNAGFTYDIADFKVNEITDGGEQYLDFGLTSTGQQNYDDSNARQIDLNRQVTEYSDLSAEDSFYGTPNDSDITVTEEVSVTGGGYTTYLSPTTERIETSESYFWTDEKNNLQAEYDQAKHDWAIANPDKRSFEFSRTDNAKLLQTKIDKADLEIDKSVLRREIRYDENGNPTVITEGFYNPETNTFNQTSQSRYRSGDDINEELNREAFDDFDDATESDNTEWTTDNTTVSGIDSAGNPVVDTNFDKDGNPISESIDAELASNTETTENSYINSQNIQNPANQRTPDVSELRGERNLDDWRVRLRLAPQSDYLYNATDPGILAPLKPTDGVIFPYTPSITTAHVARYNPYDLPHSNYRGFFYSGSNQNEIVVNAKFTAQDSKEAQYLLAVMHFLRSCTKMFYGQDAQRGTPPPLVFLSGLGDHQFNEHPCVVSNVNINLPSDVDYISTANTSDSSDFTGPTNRQSNTSPNFVSSILSRLFGTGLGIGGVQEEDPFGTAFDSTTSQNIFRAEGESRVPTSMEIYFNLLPIQTRAQISNEYSLKGYASGKLLKRGYW